MKNYFTLPILFILLLFNCSSSKTDVTLQTPQNIVFKIKPSKTDFRIKTADTPHYITYNPSINQGKLLLFLAGTYGVATKGPKNLFKTAIEQGYRVINLQYITNISVSRICSGETLTNNSSCAEEFRQKRIYGDNDFSLILDEPQDAIVNRLTKLLIYLSKNDKKGNWEFYLENGHPKWEQIAVSGQSQGGGMAAYIAKKQRVPRVIVFSGGWDYSTTDRKEIANWYYTSSVTPYNCWYGTYHVKEPTATTIEKTYIAMNIPENHVYGLDLAVPDGKKAHSNGVRNINYKNLWIKMLGKGN
ncbi:hypothetical protein Q4Q35_00910 [Flavivirga aquimarina]|uniref:Alpha/beta hydrolase n=1 Tax=Flavivirga aquimarina TaxID=2027862 RepID=A0ABT8W5G2_9FLAO|nr:hypothetical protein [Flavivirga aquimarina]MDO5968355.1 hypothetical protein [Flavivirga aquimarina]